MADPDDVLSTDPNAGGKDRLAGDMGVSSERTGEVSSEDDATNGVRDTVSNDSQGDGRADGETPPEQSAGGPEDNPENLSPEDPDDELPEAETDPEPPEAPGGADAVERDPDDLPLQTPDQPRSAQVKEEDVPNEIESPEKMDEATDDNQDLPAGTEPPV